ncbi:MAG: hypothetical protein FWF01_03960, partial [Alphaproteobacteria bacterium]|nr:hypothetical protein [Alphaproteobacteria bacterium]
VALFKGDIDNAAAYAANALKERPGDAYALMVSGVTNDIYGRFDLSRRNYEDILSQTGRDFPMGVQPQYGTQGTLGKTAEQRLNIARARLAPFMISTANDASTPVFVKSDATGMDAENMAIGVGFITGGGSGDAESHVFNLGFSEDENNYTERFSILQELRREGLITDKEYTQRRNANIGALLPLSKPAPALGFNRPVPPSRDIIARLAALRQAQSIRAISAGEYMAERSVIIDALAPASPSSRMPRTAPPSGLLPGAEAVRKLQFFREAGLITDAEMAAERTQIELAVSNSIIPPAARTQPQPAATPATRPPARSPQPVGTRSQPNPTR